MLEQGLLYPKIDSDDLSHISLQKAIGILQRNGNGRPLQAYRRSLGRVMRDTAPGRVVMSSEHFFSMPHGWIGPLVHALEPLFPTISVVLYLRSQRDLWMALYNQRLKALRVLPSHPMWGTADFVGPSLVRNMFYTDYLDAFRKQVGERHVIVRLYDRSTFPEGDITNDFLNLLGTVSNGRPPSPGSTVNPSLGWKGVAYALQIAPRHHGRNSHGPVARAMRRAFMRAKREGLADWMGASPNYLSRSEQERIHDHYAANNDRLAKCYLAGRAVFDWKPRPRSELGFDDIIHEELGFITAIIREQLDDSSFHWRS